jgi:hypothetical protein
MLKGKSTRVEIAEKSMLKGETVDDIQYFLFDGREER